MGLTTIISISLWFLVGCNERSEQLDCIEERCSEDCRGLGFPGGSCRGGVCQCQPPSRLDADSSEETMLDGSQDVQGDAPVVDAESDADFESAPPIDSDIQGDVDEPRRDAERASDVNDEPDHDEIDASDSDVPDSDSEVSTLDADVDSESGLHPDYVLPDPSGDTCSRPTGRTECDGYQSCRPINSEEGRCEGCEPCLIMEPCTQSHHCDISYACFMGYCSPFCLLGTFMCGIEENCIDIGYPEWGVCLPNT